MSRHIGRMGASITKADRLNARLLRRERKALRKSARQQEHAARQAAGLKGAPIADLPADYQGLARTLAYGDSYVAP